MESGQRIDHLREHSIGFAQVLFQLITHMAPAAAVAFSLLVGFSFAGPVLPLSVLLALGVALLIAHSVGQPAKQMPSAVGLYTYSNHTPTTGIDSLVRRASLLIGSPGGPLLCIVFAASTSVIFQNNLGINIQWSV